MRRFFLTTLAAVLAAAGMLPANQAMAYEQEHFEMQRRIAQLEGIVADLQQSQTIRTSYEGDPAPVEEGASVGCSSCGGSGCNHCCITRSCCPPAGGFFSNFEMGFVQPFANNGDAPTLGTAAGALAGGLGAPLAGAAATAAALAASPIAATPTALGTFVAPRVTLGYQIPGGMGFRTRYFTFDHNNTVLTDAVGNTLTSRLRLQTWDVETFGSLVRGRHSGTMFGGYRYADFNTLSTATSAATATGFTARQGAGGNGITGGITGTSQIGNSGRFSINSGVRGSLLFGDLFSSVLNANTGANVYQKTQINNMFSIWEVSLGSMYKMPLRNGSNLLIGSSIEAQLWQGGGSLNPWTYVTFNNPTAIVNGTNGSFAMLGFWNSVGLSY